MRSGRAAILWRERARTALIYFTVCGCFLSLAACSPQATRPVISPTATAAALQSLPLPPALGAYHIFVSDLVSGDVYSLGAQTISAARSVHGLGLGPGGAILYATDVAGDRLLMFHLSGGRLSDERTAPTGPQPVHMVSTPDGRYVFVTDFSGAEVTVIDTTTMRDVATLRTPAAPHSIVRSPDGRYAYVACYLGAAVAVIDLAQRKVVGTIALPAQARPYGLAISKDGRYLYASDNFSGRLYTIDAIERKALTSTQVGLRPALEALSPDGRTLYVTNGGSHSLSVVDVKANPAAPRVTATVSLDGYPHGVSVTPDGRYIAVADTVSGDVDIVDGLTHLVIATVSGMKYPNDTLSIAA